MTAANRGKYAEAKVREFLKVWAEQHAHFTFNRINDAHSAKGAMSNPTHGDFQWFLDTMLLFDNGSRFTRNGLIEVKEVNHVRLLPYKNFATDQVGRMRIREMAGSEPLIVVCFRPEVGKAVWRSAPLAFFMARDLSRGSWDMGELPGHPSVNILLTKHMSCDDQKACVA